MKEFWKKEWQLFLKDMQNLGEFCLQPVTFSTSAPRLEAAIEEREVEIEKIGFWQNQWGMFKNELSNAKDFLTQPVRF